MCFSFSLIENIKNHSEVPHLPGGEYLTNDYGLHSKRVPGSNPGWGLSVWSLHVLMGMSVSVDGYVCFVSVWSCYGLLTCPGCTLPLTQ